MKSGFPIPLAALVASLFLTDVAMGEGPRMHGPGGRDPSKMILRHADEIGLDERMREEIEAIVAETQPRGEQLSTDLRAAHEEMRALLSADRPDRAAVMKQADVIGELETERRKLRFDAMLRIQERLTPEQRQALRELREKRRAEHGRKGRGPHGDGRHPRSTAAEAPPLD
jgi:Spy/CpxP family protein refolding chaperone